MTLNNSLARHDKYNGDGMHCVACEYNKLLIKLCTAHRLEDDNRGRAGRGGSGQKKLEEETKTAEQFCGICT